MTDITIIKPKQAKNKKYMLVSYGRMNTLGWFEHQETNIPKMPSRVVVKTSRGLELGQIVGQFCPYRGGQFKLSQDQTKKYFEDSEIDISIEDAGKFIRYATADDISEERHLRKIAEEELESCRQFAKELNLPMKIVDAEHIFGGERLILYFVSDSRVDFRELVKKIARERQTRIEMRQIGSRDEAKLLGDIESCGQECCCIRFLKALKPVNMRMAKMQKATLDPSKISGYCGRLKCCLRYEDKTYTELKKNLPKKNSIVKTKYGQGKVIDTQILTQLVMIEQNDGTKIAVPVEELEVIPSTPTERQKQDDTKTDESQPATRESEKQQS
jgi:cell fate regulator YaaT (PSP1 superfamily)